MFAGRAPGMSLFPVVSQVDAVDANYVTIKTAEGFLVHYHDLQRMEEPGASPTPSHPRPRSTRTASGSSEKTALCHNSTRKREGFE